MYASFSAIFLVSFSLSRLVFQQASSLLWVLVVGVAHALRFSRVNLEENILTTFFSFSFRLVWRVRPQKEVWI